MSLPAIPSARVPRRRAPREAPSFRAPRRAAPGTPRRARPEAPGPAGVPDPGWAAGPDHPAYVIHTSGSTGRPKGVVVPHRALAARVGWMREHYGLTADDEVLQFASLSFDTHAEEIFPALTAGARLVVPDPGSTLPDHLRLAAARRMGPTVLDLPTPYWHELADDLDAVARPPGLRLLILGADQVQPGAVAAWRSRFGDTVRVVNSYGPTETTVIAATADLGSADALHRPPIGSPVGGTVLTVCDPLGRLMPQGAAGELLVGGAGVTYGYGGRARGHRAGLRARPVRTARLPPLPHRRPGPLADGRPAGIPGPDRRPGQGTRLRVEPGEVEAALLALDGVGRAVVTVRDEALVGYVVPERGGDVGGPGGAGTPPAGDTPAGQAGGGLSTSALRAALAARLPAHLVPNSLVVLDALPLTPNGKVDRLALPAPERRPDLGPGYVAPRTDAEALVGEVWTEVLGLDRAGALDDFFDLGGHSLLATRVVARIRAAAEGHGAAADPVRPPHGGDVRRRGGGPAARGDRSADRRGRRAASRGRVRPGEKRNDHRMSSTEIRPADSAGACRGTRRRHPGARSGTRRRHPGARSETRRQRRQPAVGRDDSAEVPQGGSREQHPASRR